MPRPVTLFTGQWADLPLETLAQKVSEWGFDGLELACWGDHFEVDKALEKDSYVREKRDLLEKYNLKCFAISNHLVGQCVCDPIDNRHKAILPPRLWGDGDPEGVRQRAAEEMKNTAKAAKLFGVDVVNGFTGSSVWAKLYFFPPTSQADIDAGYQDFADRWIPILDTFQEQGVKFGLEVHPTEIAYDIITFERALKAVNNHPAFGINFDPSHLIHQFIDPVELINAFPDRIFHVHVKDSRVQLTGRNSILSSHLDFGDHRRGWDFVSPGHGDVRWDPIIRALNRIGYQGPLSIEWEDSGMDREFGAQEALQVVRKADFAPSAVAFDAAFAKE
ncbi:sugar phosphate isomerase/epimerase [Litorilinea aerophila]|uniref:Sugar phosphate isomerase/epimerase n=1 Tax=Litorilinea aerophila TaxID=1204385 RepID=A0A540VKU0_9CHLR|nr:sugar phosphate isomerase/epimerase family protein [Litorilinea aerophila]MCC9075021.1 sugar phosphate isomerase/epimerase [Litorilinea aerophila]OUC06407.1 AP endonuclease [Litorilinea aerophila]GIV79805.1 MAG: AP endonuclease [Litorilinea sp.]